MWLILACGFDGCAGNDVELARAAGWNAEAAIIGFPDPDYPNWRHTWGPADIDGIEPSARFATQRACLHALRRAMPEHEETRTYAHTGRGWETENVTHGPDYVEKFEAVGWVRGSANMVRTYDFACFREGPRVG